MTDSPRQEADVDSVASHWHRVPIYIPDSLIPAANLPPALGPLPCNLCECCHEFRPTKTAGHAHPQQYISTTVDSDSGGLLPDGLVATTQDHVDDKASSTGPRPCQPKELLGLIVKRQALPRQSPSDCTGLNRCPQFLPDVTHPPQMAHRINNRAVVFKRLQSDAVPQLQQAKELVRQARRPCP